MKIRNTLYAVCVVSALTPLLHGATPEQRAAQIAPLVTDQTILIAHVDLGRVDFALLETLRGALFGSKVGSEFGLNELAQLRPVAEPLLNELKKLGAADLYVVVSMDEFPLPRTYIAIAAAENANDIRRAIIQAGHPEKAIVVTSGLVVLGQQRAIERFGDLKPVKRAEVADALRAANDAHAALLLIPSSDIRRAIGETLRLPQPLGADASRVIADGIQWATLQLQAKRQSQVTLIVKSKDEAAAKSLEKIIGDSLRLLSQLPSTGIDPEVVARLADKPRVQNDRLAWTLTAENGKGDLADLLNEPIRRMREAANRAQISNNLKQLGLAMHLYHDAHQHLPDPAIRDAQGKPLLSWRVSVLPFLEHGQLYEEFHLDEPWDSEHNKKLIERMPKVFAAPSANLPAGQTTYKAPVGPLALFQPAGPRLRDILDGTSNTILIVNVLPEDATIWTKPDEFVVDPDKPTAGLLAERSDGFHLALADGSVHFLAAKEDGTLQLGSLNLTMDKLLAMFGPNDGK